MSDATTSSAPLSDTITLEQIRATRALLGDAIYTTPVWQWRDRALAERIGAETEVFVKIESWQVTGSFKPRGALTVMMHLGEEERRRGVTAFSAGNHAIAVSYAARQLGVSAKVVMPMSAPELRVNMCRALGAEVIRVDTVHDAVARVGLIQADEGRFLVHPFDGPYTALGSATLALEFMEQTPGLEVVLIPVGGGGLLAGMGAAIKQMQPDTLVIGVEPEGADSMHRSFAAGSPQKLDRVTTIADSLGAPLAMQYSYDLCRRYTDKLVLVSDAQMRDAMRLFYYGMKLVVEPAAAATTAALVGELAEEVHGKRVGILACGANIDIANFTRLLGED